MVIENKKNIKRARKKLDPLSTYQDLEVEMMYKQIISAKKGFWISDPKKFPRSKKQFENHYS